MPKGMIGKALRGAAAVGVPMLMAEHRAQIMAKRDAQLEHYQKLHREDTQAHQVSLQEDRHSHQTAERIAGEEFASSENNKNRNHRAFLQDQRIQGQIDLEGTRHTHAMELVDYETEKGVGKGSGPTANMKDVKAMVAAGVFETEKEAWESLKSTTKSSDVVRVYNTLVEDQKAQAVGPYDKEYRTPRELFTEAENIIKGLESKQPGNDFIEGKIYVDSNGNKARRVNGAWEPL